MLKHRALLAPCPEPKSPQNTLACRRSRLVGKRSSGGGGDGQAEQRGIGGVAGEGADGEGGGGVEAVILDDDDAARRAFMIGAAGARPDIAALHGFGSIVGQVGSGVDAGLIVARVRGAGRHWRSPLCPTRPQTVIMALPVMGLPGVAAWRGQ